MEILSSLTLIILIIAVAINLLLGIASYRSNNKSATNALFTILSLVLSAWLFAMYISQKPTNADEALFTIRLTIFLATPMSLLFYLFSNTLPSDKLLIKGRYLVLLLLFTGFVMAVTLSPYAFTGVEIVNDFPSPTTGPGMGLFALCAVGFSLLAIINLYQKSKKLTGEQKKQVVYVFWGIILMYGSLIITILVPVALFKISAFVPFFPIYTLFFTCFTAYSIIKHQLLQLRVMGVEALIVLLWIVLFSKLFVPQSNEELAIDLFIFISIVSVGVVLIRAVTKELEQREKLEILTERLQDLDRRKDEFLSIAAHELRAPMTAIKGYISMLMEGDAGELPPSAMEYLQIVLKSNNRLVRLVNNMLNVSRIEEGRQVYQMGLVNLSQAVKSVFEEFVPVAQNKGLTFLLHISDNIPNDKVYVDQDRIHEVVSNLISNAIKYTDHGLVDITLLTTPAGFIRFEVKDSGKGIAKVDQEKLFQKYYRVESAVGRAVGTGLGLYIAKLLIEKFGGKIGFTSEVDKGSTFWFELPTVESDAGKPSIYV